MVSIWSAHSSRLRSNSDLRDGTTPPILSGHGPYCSHTAPEFCPRVPPGAPRWQSGLNPSVFPSAFGRCPNLFPISFDLIPVHRARAWHDESRIGDSLGFRHTHNIGFRSGFLPMIEHSSSFDMWIFDTDFFRRFHVTKMRKCDAPKEASWRVSCRIKTNRFNVLVDYGATI
jgi:hypothetical protein